MKKNGMMWSGAVMMAAFLLPNIANHLDSVLLSFASTTPSRIRATPSTSKGKHCNFPFCVEGVASSSDDGVVETPHDRTISN